MRTQHNTRLERKRSKTAIGRRVHVIRAESEEQRMNTLLLVPLEVVGDHFYRQKTPQRPLSVAMKAGPQLRGGV